MNKRTTLLLILAGAFLISAALLFLYPVHQTHTAQQNEQEKIQSFSAYLEKQKMPQAPHESGNASEPLIAFEGLLEACRNYNERIFTEGQCNLDAQTMKTSTLNLAAYGYKQEVFAVLSCPTIDIEVPVYLGASAANLDKGVAVLGQTSLPIGGKNTSCVIAGHRSWNAAIRFRAIEDLQLGDCIYLTNPWETLTYRVTSSKNIVPNNLNEIKIQQGKDLLILFTCTIPNSSRYLVICQRTEERNLK